MSEKELERCKLGAKNFLNQLDSMVFNIKRGDMERAEENKKQALFFLMRLAYCIKFPERFRE